MKMVMIAYNEAIDIEVMEILGRCSVRNYTKMAGVFGKGEASGTHLGNDIWPGRNNVLYIACEEAQAKQLMMQIKEARKKLGKEGIKAFCLPVEDMS